MAWEGTKIRMTERQLRRFSALVERRGSAECWPFKGFLSPLGYGVFSTKKAHRLAYWIEFGEIPQFSVVMHTCDNRACCNPAHLRLGTQKDNLGDCKEKGRLARCHGEFNNLHRLTIQEVRAIRARYATGAWTQSELARIYGVTQSGIWSVVSGRTWGFDLPNAGGS